MRHQEIQTALREELDIADQDILSGNLSRLSVGELVKTAMTQEDGRFFFPDQLYDSHRKRKRRASNRKSVEKLVQLAENNGLDVVKYRDFLPQDSEDSVYNVATVQKAKRHEVDLLGDFPRIGKLERTLGRDGLIHVQGIAALPHCNRYPSDNFQLLNYDDLRSGTSAYVGYLLKPSDQNLEREKDGKLTGPFELALIALGDWYMGSLRNKLQGRAKNPQTVWTIGIPRG